MLALPHRGRLNLLTGMLNVPLEKLFHKLKGLSEFPNDVKSAIGDVTSHLTASVDLNVNERKVHVTVLRNPSHLEAVNSVSMGKTRGIMQAIKDGAYDQRNDQSRWSNKALNVQVCLFIGKPKDVSKNSDFAIEDSRGRRLSWSRYQPRMLGSFQGSSFRDWRKHSYDRE